VEGYQALTQFFTLGTAIIALTCVMVTAGAKGLVENIWPHLKKAADENHKDVTYKTPLARWWGRVILPAIPVVLGGLMGFLPLEYLFSAIEDKGSRVFYGLVVGWLSTTIYKIVKKAIAQKTGVELPPGPNGS